MGVPETETDCSVGHFGGRDEGRRGSSRARARDNDKAWRREVLAYSRIAFLNVPWHHGRATRWRHDMFRYPIYFSPSVCRFHEESMRLMGLIDEAIFVLLPSNTSSGNIRARVFAKIFLIREKSGLQKCSCLAGVTKMGLYY